MNFLKFFQQGFYFTNFIHLLLFINFLRKLEEICGYFLVQISNDLASMIQNKENLKKTLKSEGNNINTLKVKKR